MTKKKRQFLYDNLSDRFRARWIGETLVVWDHFPPKEGVYNFGATCCWHVSKVVEACQLDPDATWHVVPDVSQLAGNLVDVKLKDL